MGQINTNNYPTVDSLADADLLIVENATNGTGTTTPKQLRENAIGTDTLQTASQTVTGAINELKHEIDLGAGVARYDVDTITSGYLGQFSGSANLLLLHLTTDGTADATNGYMMMLSYSRPVARFAIGRLVDADGVAYKQDVYADNTIICTISGNGEGTESDPVQVVILGVINAGFMLTPTAVVSDRDIIDGQGNTLSVLAEALTKTASGNPVVISDCAGGKARSLKTTINAIQDLHGLPFPYVGGAYKNKLPMTVESIKANNIRGTWSGNTYTVANGTFDILTDADGNVTGIEINGTFAATVSIKLLLPTPKQDSYILTGCPSGGDASTYHLWGGVRNSDNTGWITSFNDNGSGYNFSVSAESAYIQVEAEVKSGYTANHVVFKPMIRLATESDASFAPYSNECPISGRDSVVVDDTGKNLADVELGSYGTNGSKVSTSDRVRTKAIMYLKKGTYTISATTKASGQTPVINYAFWASADTSGSNTRLYDSAWLSSPYTLTLTEDKYVSLIFKYSSGNNITLSDLSVQLEYGDTATDYTPYVTPTSATIQLGQTVYGADINWDTGVMTVKTARIAFDGSENWTASNGSVTACMRVESPVISDAEKNSANNHLMGLISNMFKEKTPDQTYVGGESNIGFSMGMDGKISICQTGSKNMVVADWKTWLATNPLQVEYELATPTTIQLTPEQLEMLKGYNRVSIDNGSIELGYIAKLT